MNKQDMMKIQQCVLRVNIHCDGCKHKVKKKLQKIEGVYNVSVDVEQGKVTVSGKVDPATLIKKLEKSGKHAQLLGPQKGSIPIMNNQFKNIQIDNLGKDSKTQKGAKGQQIKGPLQNNVLKDVKFPGKEQKSVKFNLPEADDDDDEDDFDDDDFDFDEDDEFDDEFDGDFGPYQKPPGKAGPVVGRGGHGPQSNKANPLNGHPKGNKGANNNVGKKGKKGGGINKFLKGMLGRSGSKNGNKEKRQKEDGKKNSVKNGTFLPGEGKGSAMNGKNNMHNIRAGGKNDGGPKMESKQKGFHEINAKHRGGGGGKNMGPMGNYQAVQGLPAAAAPQMNVGHFQGGFGQGDLYNQQYMAHMMMMMNQQRQNEHDAAAYHPFTYARPHPSMFYGPPPPATDQYTHIFSDENTGSCSIM